MFAWYLHESVFSILVYVARSFEGYSAQAFQVFLDYYFTGYMVTGVLVAMGAWVFRKRLHWSYFVIPFAAVNVLWFAAGYPTSLPWPLPSMGMDNSLTTSAIEMAYTFTFLLGFWKSFR